MTLTPAERKRKLGHGAATKIAKSVKGRNGKRLTIGHVAQVLRGLRPDRKVERVAARHLGMKIEDAFPEYYEKETASQAPTPD